MSTVLNDESLDELIAINVTCTVMTETEFSLGPDQWRLVDVMTSMRRSPSWRHARHLVGEKIRGEVRHAENGSIVLADTASGECP